MVLRVDNILEIKRKRSWRATEVIRLRSTIKMRFPKKNYGQDFDHMQYIYRNNKECRDCRNAEIAGMHRLVALFKCS